ncbi:MAG: CoA-binding protein [Elusimicrobia bacterium]|nr:CoA-binding protein [Elusimicrobiota bacterium]
MLKSAKTIAVVGLSPKEERPSHWIAQYLRQHGYRVIGVNPGHAQIQGEKVYPSLSAIPEPVDLVDFFVRSDRVAPIVEEAIAKGAKYIWMQEGVVNNEAAERARAAGLGVVMNRCIFKEHAAR